VFDFFLDFIIELVAVRSEELDAIVRVGLWEAVMTIPASARRLRVTYATPGVGRGPMKSTSTPSIGCLRKWRFEHVARESRVLAQDDFVPPVSARLGFEMCEYVAGGPPEFEGGFGGHGFDICRAADAIRAEDFFCSFQSLNC